MRVTRRSLARRGSISSNTVSSVRSEWIKRSGVPAPCWSYSTCAPFTVRNIIPGETSMLKIVREERGLSPFELAEPKSLREAFALLSGDGVRPMSGGTALMLMMKAGVLRPTRLVSLRRLGLDRLESGPGGELRVGAMVTLRALEKSPLLKDWPVIARTLRTLSNVRVRNVATVGGHLAHGDPHMDLPPLLSALGATVTIAGAKGERSCPVEALYAGYLETTLAQ